MEAIILAGGFGTRLKHIVSDVPKPMAPISNKPFLNYILDYLVCSGVNKVIMAVGYKSEKIISYFSNSYKNLEIIYSLEDTPLLTGGAIKKALSACNDDQIFIINGDTFFDVNLKEMRDFHFKKKAELTIATKEMFNFDRYGTVRINNDKIIAFEEKKYMERGTVNGGIYYLNKKVLDNICMTKFSFETDIMEKKICEIPMYAYNCSGYFIDIGIPEDYFKAQRDFEIKGEI